MKFNRNRHRATLHEKAKQILREVAEDAYSDGLFIPEFVTEFSINSFKNRWFRVWHYIYYATSDGDEPAETFWELCGAAAADSFKVRDHHDRLVIEKANMVDEYLREINKDCPIIDDCARDAACSAGGVLDNLEDEDPTKSADYWESYIYYFAEFHAMSCNVVAGIPRYVVKEGVSNYLTYKTKNSLNMQDALVKETKKPSEGYVYLIGSLESMFFKIGISKTPQKRLRALQTANPVALEIISVAKCANPQHHERQLHKKFKKHRQSGEWFKMTGEALGSCINKFQQIEAA